MRVAEEAVDQACEAGNTDPERAFIDTMLRDLEEHRGEPTGTSKTASIEDLVEQLPDPLAPHGVTWTELDADRPPGLCRRSPSGQTATGGGHPSRSKGLRKCALFH